MIRLNEQPGRPSFDPETLLVLAEALDEAWLRVNAGAYVVPTPPARYLPSTLSLWPRNRQRLTDGVLRRLSL
jgi:hypothetical protein